MKTVSPAQKHDIVNLPVMRRKCVTRLWREERAPQMRQPAGKKAGGAAQSRANDRWTTGAGRKEGKKEGEGLFTGIVTATQ